MWTWFSSLLKNAKLQLTLVKYHIYLLAIKNNIVKKI